MSNTFAGPGMGAVGGGGYSDPQLEKIPTRRKQKILALAAGLVAVLTFLLVLVGLGGQTGAGGMFVVRTSRPLPALHTLVGGDLAVVQVPEEYLEPGVLAAPTEQEALDLAGAQLGAFTRVALPAGVQVHPEYLSTDLGFVAGEGAPVRLLSIRAMPSVSAAGLIRPGDRVDVYAVDSQTGLAGLVLSDVPVVSVGPVEDQLNALADTTGEPGSTQSRSELMPGDPVPGVYVVAVNATDVSRLVAADGNGTLYLALRPPGSGTEAGGPVDLQAVLCGSGTVLDLDGVCTRLFGTGTGG